MKHENPETEPVREQKRYIRILEEQLSVCKEQIKAQELLLRKMKQMGIFLLSLKMRIIP